MFSVLTRDDTLIGACHALGEDFGFDPAWLRALFALGLFMSPAMAAAAYAGCIALVALSRRLVPEPRPAQAAEPAERAAAEEESLAQAWEELALAA